MDDKELTKVLKLRKNLFDELKEAISIFLKQNLDVFTWKHSYMEGIDPKLCATALTWTQTKSWSGKSGVQWMLSGTKP